MVNFDYKHIYIPQQEGGTSGQEWPREGFVRVVRRVWRLEGAIGFATCRSKSRRVALATKRTQEPEVRKNSQRVVKIIVKVRFKACRNVKGGLGAFQICIVLNKVVTSHSQTGEKKIVRSGHPWPLLIRRGTVASLYVHFRWIGEPNN